VTSAFEILFEIPQRGKRICVGAYSLREPVATSLENTMDD
jgi:hypothetical protein